MRERERAEREMERAERESEGSRLPVPATLADAALATSDKRWRPRAAAGSWASS